MADMTPQEAAKRLRQLDAFSGLTDSDYAAIRLAADALDPPKPKAEWTCVDEQVLRDAEVVAICYDDAGMPVSSTSYHRATVTMHALRADEEGHDVIAAIEKLRGGD